MQVHLRLVLEVLRALERVTVWARDSMTFVRQQKVTEGLARVLLSLYHESER